MQLYPNTNKKLALLKQFNAGYTIIAIGFILATAGLLFTSNATADDQVMQMDKTMAGQQLVSIEGNHTLHSTTTEKTQRMPSDGSAASDSDTHIETKGDIGGFSRIDGAMMGAYGDGEYAD